MTCRRASKISSEGVAGPFGPTSSVLLPPSTTSPREPPSASIAIGSRIHVLIDAVRRLLPVSSEPFATSQKPLASGIPAGPPVVTRSKEDARRPTALVAREARTHIVTFALAGIRAAGAAGKRVSRTAGCRARYPQWINLFPDPSGLARGLLV